MAEDKKSGYIGYVYLDRHIQEGWLWEEKPFSKGQAWIDLILLANYEDKKIPYKDKLITCKRGTVNLSVLYLADRWGWNRKTVDIFLKQLQDGGSIEYKPSRYRTTIILVNYGLYQNKRTTKFQRNGQRSGQRNSTSVLGSDEMRDNEVDNTMDNSMDNSMDNTMDNSMDNTMDNSMDNSMDITKEGKGRISKDKGRISKDKGRISKEKEIKENINDSLFMEEHNGLSREEWESGTRMMGQPY